MYNTSDWIVPAEVVVIGGDFWVGSLTHILQTWSGRKLVLVSNEVDLPLVFHISVVQFKLVFGRESIADAFLSHESDKFV